MDLLLDAVITAISLVFLSILGIISGVAIPGLFLAATVLAVNMLGDGLRDTLDPKMAKRV